jgi:hypothetical protein
LGSIDTEDCCIQAEALDFFTDDPSAATKIDYTCWLIAVFLNELRTDCWVRVAHRMHHVIILFGDIVVQFLNHFLFEAIELLYIRLKLLKIFISFHS